LHTIHRGCPRGEVGSASLHLTQTASVAGDARDGRGVSAAQRADTAGTAVTIERKTAMLFDHAKIEIALARNVATALHPHTLAVRTQALEAGLAPTLLALARARFLAIGVFRAKLVR